MGINLEAFESHSKVSGPDLARAETPKQKPRRRRLAGLRQWARPLIIAVVAAVSVACAVMFYPNIREFLSTVETEDAYVTGHVHQVSSKVAGTIDKVLVQDNQWVKEGQVLATIDARDIQVEVSKAQAHLLRTRREALASAQQVEYAARNFSAVSENASGSIAQSENAIARAEAGIHASESDVAVAEQQVIQREAELHKAKLDLDRYTNLLKERAVTRESADTVRRDYDVAVAARESALYTLKQAKSRLNQANADLKIARSQLISSRATALQARAANAQIDIGVRQKESSEAAIKEAEADLVNAKLRLSYTKIVAPVDGRVGRKNIEVGQRVQPGTALLAIVGNDKWIVANYKETQLKDMRIGQPVRISVDAFGGREFSGKVESFAPASGASFALLPPDNATGNFTKIVQRIPVKIVFDRKSLGEFESLISPGMSCIVKVWVR